MTDKRSDSNETQPNTDVTYQDVLTQLDNVKEQINKLAVRVYNAESNAETELEVKTQLLERVNNIDEQFTKVSEEWLSVEEIEDRIRTISKTRAHAVLNEFKQEIIDQHKDFMRDGLTEVLTPIHDTIRDIRKDYATDHKLLLETTIKVDNVAEIVQQLTRSNEQITYAAQLQAENAKRLTDAVFGDGTPLRLGVVADSEILKQSIGDFPLFKQDVLSFVADQRVMVANQRAKEDHEKFKARLEAEKEDKRRERKHLLWNVVKHGLQIAIPASGIGVPLIKLIEVMIGMS